MRPPCACAWANLAFAVGCGHVSAGGSVASCVHANTSSFFSSRCLQVLVKYIDEAQACILDARSAAAALCKPVSREEKVPGGSGSAVALGCTPRGACSR